MTKLLIQFEEDSSVYYKQPSKTESGYDLFTVEDITVQPFECVLLPFFIRVECVNDEGQSLPFLLTARSSIYKTPLVMANSMGIIDKTYRGILKAPVRNVSNTPFTIRKGVALFQIVQPSLEPFESMITVIRLSETERGSGGFGSTGNTV